MTLATFGYGDAVPRGEVARGPAMAEAIAGQLTLAVMVARLVSPFIQRPRPSNDSRPTFAMRGQAVTRPLDGRPLPDNTLADRWRP